MDCYYIYIGTAKKELPHIVSLVDITIDRPNYERYQRIFNQSSSWIKHNSQVRVMKDPNKFIVLPLKELEKLRS